MDAIMSTQINDFIVFDRESAALAEVLERGRWRDPRGTLWSAQPQAVEADGRVRVALCPPPPAAARVGVWAQALRLPSVTAALTPCAAVWLYGASQGWAVSVGVAVCALVGAALLQLAVNLLNDVEDHARLIDLPGTLGGAGVIQAGQLSAAQVRRVAYGLLGAGLVAGAPALWRAPGPLLVIGAVAALGAWGYSAGPGLKYKALGDLTVAALCGPCLTLGFSYAAFGRADAMAWCIGGFLGLAAVAILHVNNFQDMETDQARGARTVAGLLGVAGSKAYLVALYAVGLGVWTAGALGVAALPWWAAALPWAAAAVPVRLTAALLTQPVTAPSLRGARWEAARSHLLLGVGACAALAIPLFV
jgi:1,4-dihydroxy-2-naphthoate octaprenyltransferase